MSSTNFKKTDFGKKVSIDRQVQLLHGYESDNLNDDLSMAMRYSKVNFASRKKKEAYKTVNKKLAKR